jgi:2'-5' RNA ligase
MKHSSVPPFGGTVYFYIMEMYFIALVAPEDINVHILKWKLLMQERFDCNVALRSPAHITLVPPFWMDSRLEKELTESLDLFSETQCTFIIHLKDFSCFKPRVIFVSPEKNNKLEDLQKNAEDFLIAQHKFPLKLQNRPFHPHVSIASRDLHKKTFQEAWGIFENKKYEADWKVKSISLLKHNKKNWDVIHTSQLNE